MENIETTEDGVQPTPDAADTEDRGLSSIEEAKMAARKLAEHDVIDPDAIESKPDSVSPATPQP